ncbi:GNAT family N-acetyltransferase [Scatolibacter rhodanostii]|uniref:GNAT family N-acetyltransferase n=1 Tax=Scatolibacter rhodanostii TaxID=2014781 RepID=UPI000C078F08|nr:GNAT family N-acetyltransferase [Scatolibacter rhodanostii]
MLDITFEKATVDDVKTIIGVKNASFYEDYIKHGESRGYNNPIEGITRTVQNNIVYKIQSHGNMIGYISVTQKSDSDFYLNCLCVVPAYENQGIGQMAMTFLEKQFSQAKHWSLEALADKKRNIYFYQKHGYQITKEYMDGNVKIVLFEKWSNIPV